MVDDAGRNDESSEDSQDGGFVHWTPLLLALYNTRTQYPQGLVAEIRKRFPSPSTVKEGLPPQPTGLRLLAEDVNRAMLAGSFKDAITLRAQFAEEWRLSKAGRQGDGRYCIGGAFMAFMSLTGATSFPRPESLGKALRLANPKLKSSVAESFARTMLAANDSGDFEGAWRILEEAMAYGRTQSTSPLGTVYASRVEDLDLFVANDEVTVLAAGVVAGRCLLSGFSDFLAGCRTRVEIRRDGMDRPCSVRVSGIEGPGREFVVPLDFTD